MGRLKFTLTNLWFWMTMAIGCFFVENIALLTPNPTYGFDFTTFWIFAFAAFGSAIVYIVLERKKNHIGVDKILLPTLVVLFFILLATIWAQGVEVYPFADGTGQIVVSFTLEQKIQYSVFLLFAMLFTYMSTAMMFSNRTSNRSLRWLPFLYIIFTYITIGFSLFTEWGEYAAFFKGDAPQAKAFYLNANTLAIAIFIGILSCMVFNYYKTTIFANVTILVFAIAQIFTSCATSAILSIVVIPLYFVLNIAHNAKLNYIKTAIYFAVGLTIYMTLAIWFLFDGEWMKGIDENWKRFLESLDFETFTSRSFIWVTLIEKGMDTPWHLLFGRGFMTGNIHLNAACRAMKSTYDGGSHSGENGFVNLFFNFGLIGFLFYVILLGYFVYCLIRVFMRKRVYFGLLYSLCFLSLCAYNMLEQNNFFDMGFKETYMTLVFFMPVIHMHKLDLHNSKIKEFKNLPHEGKRDYYRFPHLLSMIFGALLAASSSGLILVSIFKCTMLFNPLLYTTIGLGASLFIFPYLLFIWLNGRSRTSGKVHALLNVIFILMASYFMGFIIRKYWLITSLITFGTLILASMTFYSIRGKDYFRSYFKVTIMNSIVHNLLGIGVAIGVTIGLAFLFKGQSEYNTLTFIAFMVLALVVFTAILFLVPNKNIQQSLEYMNNILLNKYRIYIKLERRTKICLNKKTILE